MSDRKSDLVNVTGLWIQESKGGSSYMSAIVERSEVIEAIEKAGTPKVKLMVFKGKKDKEKSPDYNLCVAPFVPKASEGVRPDYDPDKPDDLPF